MLDRNDIQVNRVQHEQSPDEFPWIIVEMNEFLLLLSK